jgi:transposase
MTAEEELIQLRQENSRLREQVGMQQETISLQGELIKRQQLQIRLQEQQLTRLSEQVKVLQERLAKNSHNSHLPPSSDRFVRQPKSLRKKSGKNPGGEPGHPGKTLLFSSTPEEVIVHPLKRCPHCQEDLQTQPCCSVERRQVVALPEPRLVVVEHQAECKHCPACQHLGTAAFPELVRAPIQYGPRIGAIAVYLTQQQLLPLARACEVMEDLLGISMSEGTLCELIGRCATTLVAIEEQVKEALVQADVIHQDETGLYVAGSRHWMHVTCTATLTHYQVHESRGQEALEAIGILPRFDGTSIHDGWGSYFLYNCWHATCNVHLLRELTFLAEEQGVWWAAKLKALLLDMKEAALEAREQGKLRLDPLEVVDWETRFLELLAEGDQAHPRATAPPGKRGRCKQSAARNLLDRLRKHQQAVLYFLEDLRVDFDNNLAERDLRMVKVQQKVSGCFRSLLGAQAFCRIRGYLSTLRKQGRPLLSALQATLGGHPVLPSFQST